jgi:hypothetical protein
MARVPDWFKSVIAYGEQVKQEVQANPEPSLDQLDPVSYFQHKSWSDTNRQNWLRTLKSKHRKKSAFRQSGTSHGS